MRLRHLSVMAALLVTFSPVMDALADSGYTPVGIWQPDNKETRYKIDYCGNSDKLCATLVWVTDAKPMKDTRPYLNKTFASGMKRVQSDTWKGPISFRGMNGSGTIRVLDPDHIRLTGCRFIILCASIEMSRFASSGQ